MRAPFEKAKAEVRLKGGGVMKRCCICGSRKNEDGGEPIGHCRKCGRPVCSFCGRLGVCCELDDEDEE